MRQASKKIRIGIVGCGNISETYFTNCLKFKFIEVTMCTDCIIEKAKEKSEQHQVKLAGSVEELVSSAQVDIVLNLTQPQSHAQVCLQAIEAKKHVYVEKPLGITRAEGAEILTRAHEQNVRVGAAPDTFLGGGLQTCRKIIDDGWIGQPVAATAFLAHHGHEWWHPNPEFTYQAGAGPMFGMGPYYITALVSLLGPAVSVFSSTKKTFPERTITHGARCGDKFRVEVPTHVTGVVEFAHHVTATVITSYDVWSSTLPYLEIYGSEGTLSIGDPNTFGGPVKIYRPEEKEWRQLPILRSYVENARGLGLADMACAIEQNRAHRCSGELAFHALDIMQAFHDSGQSNSIYHLKSTCSRPASMPERLLEYQAIS